MNREYVYEDSEDYLRSVELMDELGERTDLDRVLIQCHTYDICLAEKTEAVGHNGWAFIIEVTGTRGVKVSDVVERYGFMSHMTEADSLTWAEVLKRCEQRDD